jgi:nucleoside-diphosphate-sugar epimerase
MSKSRTALVTGGTGLIGSALVRRLLADGVTVECLIRKGSLSKLPSVSALRATEISYFHTDVLRKSLAGISFDVVFHLASYGVQVNDRDRDQLISGNVQLLAHVLEAVADRSPAKFIFAGSCSQYGFPAKNGELISEDQPLRPTSLYGAAKAAAELYGNALASQLKIPFFTLRLFNVFGPGEGPHRLLPSIIHALERNRPVDLTGGEQQRDLLHFDDVADAMYAAACSEHLKPYAAYNICSGVAVRIKEVGETAAEILQKPRELLQWGKLPYRSDEPMWVVGDATRFREATSWRPKLSLRDGIRSMISAVRDREHQNAI